MVSINYCSQFIQHRIVGEINLIEEDPITILHALDKCTLNELEDEATA
jgi:hypothetical protein